MNTIPDFELPKWAEHDHNGKATTLAAGSQGPGMTLKELIAISSDPDATASALSFDNIKLIPQVPSTDKVTSRLAAFYPSADPPIRPSDILLAHGCTGANSMVIQALVNSGDHIISTFPTYTPLFELAGGLGANLSFLDLHEANGWAVDLEALEALITPETKMLILNNPNNPTGSVTSTTQQRKIVEIAAKHDLILLCDEIFRPLYHTDDKPTSYLEHSTSSYNRIIVTGSLSKSWGFAGVRVGWAATTNSDLRKKMHRVREWILQDVSEMDKVVAAEVLSERCSPKILAKNLAIIRENWATLQTFLDGNKGRVSCCVPTGGSIAFIRFLGTDGKLVDDLEFGKALLEETGVLISPGQLGFGRQGDQGALKGYVRTHMCIPPEKYRRTIEGFETLLGHERYAKL